MGKKKERNKAKIESNSPPEAIKFHVEVHRDGRWQTVESFDDDPRALRGLVKARDLHPSARTRITTDTARVLIEMPPVGT